MATRKQSILYTHVTPEMVMLVQKKNATNGREGYAQNTGSLNTGSNLSYTKYIF